MLLYFDTTKVVGKEMGCGRNVAKKCSDFKSNKSDSFLNHDFFQPIYMHTHSQSTVLIIYTNFSNPFK